MPPQIRPDALWIVDGHSQLFRAYYAVRGLATISGQPTNAIFGFLQIIKKLRLDHNPSYLAVAFDLAKSFRDDFYPEYKANRGSMPEDLRSQEEPLMRLLAAMRLPILREVGFEADDVIATLADRCAKQGRQLVIVSADKDLFQLVNEHVVMLRITPEKKTEEFFDPAAVLEKMGVPPEKVVDYQALVGDSVDNIPGVPGLGPKSAAKLYETASSLEDLLANLDRVENKRWRGLLSEHADNARLSYRLAKLSTEAPLPDGVPEAFKCVEPDYPALAAIYRELEFNGFLRELEAAAPNEAAATAVAAATHQPDVAYQTIGDEASLKALVATIRKAGRFAFDTETTGVDALSAGLVGVSVAWAPGEAAYIPVGHEGMAANHPQLPLDKVREILGPLFADEKLPKIAHHAKFDEKSLEAYGFQVNGLAGDTMIAAFTLDSERSSIGLKQLSRAILGIEMTPIEDLIGKGKNQISMAEVAIDQAAPYAAADADMTLRLEDAFAPLLDAEPRLRHIYEKVEIPLAGVLKRMEQQGVGLDVPYLEELRDRFRRRIQELRAEVVEAAGEEFNLNSPKQVAAILFEKLGLTPIKKTQSGFSTDADTLEALADQHPLPKALLGFRFYEKLNSTYAEQLGKMANPKTGRIHASFSQTAAATGRLACHDPNLQNIPIREEEGRLIRRAFVPCGPGRLLIAADYSQIELRLLAHVSGDEALRGAFQRDEDVHKLTASKIYGMSVDQIGREQRAVGKTINFGVIYGMSAFRLSNDLKLERKVADKFIKDYFANYPGVTAWIEEAKKKAKETGYCETMLGRRRRLADINSAQAVRRQAAERVSVNAPIQGSAADLIKLAMLELDRRLRLELPDCHLILQVHDELVLDVPESKLEAATALARDCMENAMELTVPARADISHGANWAECK